jgi:hypothetical protein
LSPPPSPSLQTGPAHAAAEPNQVTNVTVSQADGFTTVAWTPVDGATDYQIERTAVDADDSPTATPTVVGVWRPNRQINNGSPTFADAGFNPGDRFEWRVRARIGTAEQPYSTPVFGTTLTLSGDPGIPARPAHAVGDHPGRAIHQRRQRIRLQPRPSTR